MIRLAANLSFLFQEQPFLDRFAQAAAAGFEAVEFTFLYDIPADLVAAQCQQHRLQPVLLNAPAGNLAMGDAGMAALPAREQEMRTGFRQALAYAQVIGAPHIHVLAGNIPTDADIRIARRTFVANLRWAADLAAETGRIVTIEPLNATDRPAYFLRTTRQAQSILRSVARPNVRLQLDLYHCALTEPDFVDRLADLMPDVAHVQIAGVPGRHEPDVGTMPYRPWLKAIEATGYGGHVGCEYLPADQTRTGLAWAKPWLKPKTVKA
ncbi:hydroxypyruvate isomerase family protein [Blastomonas fulva]|uniref:hydroxypyruvate isomerase family protein n=1 Tax=Blastomonas fulva TaxID=1550728 RepID=UPI003F718B05